MMNWSVFVCVCTIGLHKVLGPIVGAYGPHCWFVGALWAPGLFGPKRAQEDPIWAHGPAESNSPFYGT